MTSYTIPSEAGLDAKLTANAAADRARGNHTGTQTADTITDGTTNKAFLATERTKLAGIATAATANRTDAATDTLLAAKADLVGGLVPSSQIPAIALTNAVTVASQAAMLALTTTQVQPGDVAVRTDGAGTFILTTADPTQLANWVRLNAPTDAVTTVNGQAGTVVLAATDVGAAPASLSATVATNTTAIAAQRLGGTVNAITSSATAVAGVRNTVDATAGPVTVTLPTPTAVGQHLIITRIDATLVNAVSITGPINGAGSATATLPAVGAAGEGALWIAESLTSWTPAGSIKPKAWLDAIYPSISTTRDAPYFNASATRLTRKAVRAVRAGTGPCRVMFAGDSTMWGQYSSNVVTASPPAVAITTLAAAGLPVTQGFVTPGSSSQVGTDSRWGVGTSWAHASAQGLGNTGAWQALGAGPSDALTFTPGINCDRVDIYYLINTGIGSFTWAVDGGATTNVNCAGTAAVGKLTISMTAGSSHVITFIQSTNTVMIFGADAYLSTAPSIRIGNAGASASTSAGWATSTNAYSSLNILKAYAPDLTLILLGANDAAASVAAATYNTSMQALITAAKVSGDVALVSPVPLSSGTTNPFMLQYVQQLYNLAASNLVGIIDINGHLIDWPTANALGYMYDVIHPNTAGYAEMGAVMAATLKAVFAA